MGGVAPPASVALSGTGAGPVVSITPAAQVFAPLELGSGPAPAKTFTVANEGQLALAISSISIQPTQIYNYPGARPEQFELTGGSCGVGVEVPPDGTCTVDVSFVPTAPGLLSAELRIVDNAPGSPHVATVEGSSPAPPVIHANPPPYVAAPSVSIIHRPARLTRLRHATFWFRGSPTATNFECKLDDRPATPCDVPERLMHLRPGRHYFAVRAFDKSGRNGPAARFRWRISR
jgi:hypothetical protein